jgi:hypothetical protein
LKTGLDEPIVAQPHPPASPPIPQPSMSWEEHLIVCERVSVFGSLIVIGFYLFYLRFFPQPQ